MANFSSNLNASAQEFVPSPRSLSVSFGSLSASASEFFPSSNLSRPIGSYGGYYFVQQAVVQQLVQPSFTNWVYNGGFARFYSSEEQERINRTVFVSEIDTQITESELAYAFRGFGHVMDCRICGDTCSGYRFGFVEFENQNCAFNALNLHGTFIGTSPVPLRVEPSLSYILPVNPYFLPQTEEEEEAAFRTVYVRNIDRTLTEGEVKDFFDENCGEVSQIRIFGDLNVYTRNAFIEFVIEDDARAALGLSGTQLGDLTIRVTASKTPIRLPPVRNGDS